LGAQPYPERYPRDACLRAGWAVVWPRRVLLLPLLAATRRVASGGMLPEGLLLAGGSPTLGAVGLTLVASLAPGLSIDPLPASAAWSSWAVLSRLGFRCRSDMPPASAAALRE